MILIEPENIKDWLPPNETPKYQYQELYFSIWSYDGRAFIRFYESDECRIKSQHIKLDFLKIIANNKVYENGFQLKNYKYEIQYLVIITDEETLELIPLRDYKDYYSNILKEFYFSFKNDTINIIPYIPSKKENIPRDNFKSSIPSNDIKIYDFEYHKLAIWMYQKRAFARFYLKQNRNDIKASFNYIDIVKINENFKNIKGDILLRNDKNSIQKDFIITKDETFEIISNSINFNEPLMLIYRFDSTNESLVINHKP